MKSDFFKKVWYFIWYDDSFLSWIINVIIAFILVKFIVYPVLGLIFGTQFPLVAVVSCSMEHNMEFNSWWKENEAVYNSYSITKEEFENFHFKNGINQGDIMLLKKGDNIQVGDVIVFDGSSPNPIIHRLVISNDKLRTKGDNNPIMDHETGKVLGEAIFRIPYLGWIKIVFNGLIGQKIIKC